MNFREFWRANNGYEFQKSALTTAELRKIQDKISELQKKGLPSSKIITAIQRMNTSKLGARWKAERAYYTEAKALDTAKVAEAGEDIGVEQYKILLSPNACKKCIDFSKDGTKIFKKGELVQKNGDTVPPIHPNCYCIVIPWG